MKMLFKSKHKESGKTLVHSKPLLINAKQGYTRPPEGKAWWNTTTTVWRADEIIRRSVRDWKRLMGETGHTGSRTQSMRKDHDSVYTSTYSSFPAPLIEWILLRYAPPNCRVLDAFAGGPPRGVVAALMGYEYVGYDIRQEQIDENLNVLRNLGLDKGHYVLGDGRFVTVPDGGRGYDFALSCPPYYDLEQYSDLPTDLSNMGTYEEFLAGIYFSAIAHYKALKPGAFVCWVVGPFRNKKTGELIDFPAHVTDAFREAGFIYWQQIVIGKNFASAAKRSTNAWKGRKLVPAHEFCLVFRKPE